ncbi:unnamed protein product [Echinostoma caproni]|uniref:Ferritin n=1 Tax=Echinostoma caproni TaxID=27848 RepID=A0A183AJF3_9TREM|nr:unnamed protein product [Echinostoma caproni]
MMQAIQVHPPHDETCYWVRIRCMGASAAQSICLQSLDALLQVEHEPKNKEFFEMMRLHMISEHYTFLQDIERCSRTREIVQETKSEELRNAYNDCIHALRQFRNGHYGLVTQYAFMFD